MEKERKVAFIKNFFFLWPCDATCGILVPRSRMESTTPPAVEAQGLDWTAREVPSISTLIPFITLFPTL